MQQGRGRSGASTIAVDFAEKLIALAVSGLKVATIAFMIAVVYILYGVYAGHLAGPVDARVLQNLALMGQIMAGAGGLGVICLVIITHDEVAYAVGAGIIGLAMMLGFPLLVAGQVQGGAERAGQIITYWATTTGQIIVFVVGLRVVWEIVVFIKEAPARHAAIDLRSGEQEKPKKTYREPWGRLSRCWEMPHCHDAIKEMCPAYKNRKNCWRIRQGCNCDPYLIESLLRRGAGTHQLPEGDSTYVRSDLAGGREAGTKRTRECRNCPIFNEHQRQKFRLLNPILVSAAIIGLVLAYPIVRSAYQTVISGAASLAERLAWGTRVPASDWIQRLDTPIVWYMFYTIVGLLAMSYVLKAIEWLILERKIL